MSPEEQYQDRLKRIKKAIALGKPDRVPVVLEYSGFAAYVTETPMADFLRSPVGNLETMIRAYRLVGEADAINYGAFWPYGLCYDFLSKVRIPGIDLPANDMWQVDEKELMIRKDYDRLLEMGWPHYFERFMGEKLLEDVPEEYLPPMRKSPDVLGAWKREGLPVLSGGDVTTPFEVLCGSRSLIKFSSDLIEIPSKVNLAMDEIVPHLGARAIRQAKKRGYPVVWVGGWRSAPSMLSPSMWDRFVWPYFKRIVNEVVDSGLIALLHLDSNWTRELKRFRELPRGKCIVALDGETDIFAAKEILRDHLCIMGDVPASLLYLEEPDTVYEYCTRLIRELGPEGFILQSGCDIPANAKLENVQAMVSAAVSGTSP
ncbi:MAG: uroporphyrinogen decarboxylase family protein [Deltaproteobacteria bacterium]